MYFLRKYFLPNCYLCLASHSNISYLLILSFTHFIDFQFDVGSKKIQ